MRRQRQHSVRAAWLMAGAALALGATVRAQELATVAVDDSPTATQLRAQARDQAGANAAESARLIRRVLGEFGRKLVPLPDDPDRFMDARACAEQLLRANPEVLRRWRAIESAEARRQLDAGGAEGTVEERFKAQALAAIALGYARADLAKEAGRVVEELEASAKAVEELRPKAEALAAAARVRAQTGAQEEAGKLLAEASDTAKKIEDKGMAAENRTYALLSIASAYLATGDAKAAAGLLKLAEKSAGQVPDPEGQKNAMEKVRALQSEAERKK